MGRRRRERIKRQGGSHKNKTRPNTITASKMLCRCLPFSMVTAFAFALVSLFRDTANNGSAAVVPLNETYATEYNGTHNVNEIEKQITVIARVNSTERFEEEKEKEKEKEKEDIIFERNDKVNIGIKENKTKNHNLEIEENNDKYINIEIIENKEEDNNIEIEENKEDGNISIEIKENVIEDINIEIKENIDKHVNIETKENITEDINTKIKEEEEDGNINIEIKENITEDVNIEIEENNDKYISTEIIENKTEDINTKIKENISENPPEILTKNKSDSNITEENSNNTTANANKSKIVNIENQKDISNQQTGEENSDGTDKSVNFFSFKLDKPTVIIGAITLVGIASIGIGIYYYKKTKRSSNVEKEIEEGERTVVHEANADNDEKSADISSPKQRNSTDESPITERSTVTNISDSDRNIPKDLFAQKQQQQSTHIVEQEVPINIDIHGPATSTTFNDSTEKCISPESSSSARSDDTPSKTRTELQEGSPEVKGTDLLTTTSTRQTEEQKDAIDISEASGLIEGFRKCTWKVCPDSVDKWLKYSVDEGKHLVAEKFEGWDWCTITGNTSIPPNVVASWSVKVLKSEKRDGNKIYVGVAPFDINQNKGYNHEECGWYFNCYSSTLCSGPPHSCNDEEYGLRKEDGQYVDEGDSVGVVMDTTKGELSFILNNVNYGVAYEGIPLDKPLVPCVLLFNEGDSVELDTSEAKENMDSSITVPSNIMAKSTTWNSITLTWDEVVGASFYQIEVDGSKSLNISKINTFIKRMLFPETGHSFRVRAVKGSSASEWSVIVKGKTQKETFEACGWMECSDKSNKYAIDAKNPRIVARDNDSNHYCNSSVIVGNTPLPPNKVVSWGIKVGNGQGTGTGQTLVGVASSGATNDYGWYLDCANSKLCKGSVSTVTKNDYRREEYIPGHGKCSFVGVVINTAKGEISFSLDGKTNGVAFREVRLDEPLVPSVILGSCASSVELCDPVVKHFFAAPRNIRIEKAGWNFMALSWDAAEGASSYAIRSKDGTVQTVKGCNFTVKELRPDTEYEYSLCVNANARSEVSEWSTCVKGKTEKRPFTEISWVECPNEHPHYDLCPVNKRVVTSKVMSCDILGDIPLPLGTVISWEIKILKTKEDDGNGISIGIAQLDEDGKLIKDKWYLSCYSSETYHKQYEPKDPEPQWESYGPRKEEGKYVGEGDNVGVVMDTTKGELSFALNNVNHGAAYTGIPLDKPLVPCVILYDCEGDSVELLLK